MPIPIPMPTPMLFPILIPFPDHNFPLKTFTSRKSFLTNTLLIG